MTTHKSAIRLSETFVKKPSSSLSPPHFLVFFALPFFPVPLPEDVESLAPPKPIQIRPSAVPEAIVPFDERVSAVMKGGREDIPGARAGREAMRVITRKNRRVNEIMTSLRTLIEITH